MSEAGEESYFWLREPANRGLEVAFLCDRVLYSGRSQYQRIDVVETRAYGRMLFLDGISQSAERDEFIYHEMVTHPALFGRPGPRSVLVIGGAEGAVLREVFRHPGIERVVLVDIDGQLIEVCKRYLDKWHQGSYDDPRLEVVIDDGRHYLETCSQQFDVIVVDLSDPFEGSPAVQLFTEEFYRLVKNRLGPHGCATIQAECISPQELTLHATIFNTLRAVFPTVRSYHYTVPSFHRPDAFVLASTDPEWSEEVLPPRIEKAALPLRYLSPEVAQAMFCLPPYLLEAYEQHPRILTDEHPGLERFV